MIARFLLAAMLLAASPAPASNAPTSIVLLVWTNAATGVRHVRRFRTWEGCLRYRRLIVRSYRGRQMATCLKQWVR